MKFKKDDEGKLVLDDAGDPIAIAENGDVIPLDKVVSLGKHARVEEERDAFKEKAAKLEGQIAELSKLPGQTEELKKKLDEMTEAAAKERTEFEGRMSARDKEFALETALLKAGCLDTKAARAHVDMDKLSIGEDGKLAGFDAESFAKDKSYLFEPPRKVDSAGPSRSASGYSQEDIDKMSVDEYKKARDEGKI
jgi:hypothetical protein